MSEYDTDCSDNTIHTNLSGFSLGTEDTVPSVRFDRTFFNNSKLDGLKFYEPFHKDILVTILKDYDKYEHMIIKNWKQDFDEKCDLKKMFEKCLKNAGEKDYLSVTYSKSKNSPKYEGKYIGRWFANQWIGLQYMPRSMRHALCGNNGSNLYKNLWIDLDIQNCHPTLALHIFKLYNLNTTYLEEYINNRDKILKDIINETDCTRDEAKTMLLKILNGGADDTYLSWSINFNNEIQRNLETVSIMSEFLFIRKKIIRRPDVKRNIHAKVVNQIICSIENYILELLTLKLIEDGVIPKFKDGYKCVLIHDGLQVPWSVDNEERIKNLSEYEDYIKEKTGINIKLSVKAFDEYLKVDRSTKDINLDLLNLKNLSELSEFDYEDVKTVFERECAKIMDPIMYIQTGDRPVMRSKEKFKDAFANVKYRGYNERSGKYETKSFINDWLTDTKMRTYDLLDFIPPPLEAPNNVYNMWIGFDILNTPLPIDFDINNNEYIKRYLKHIDVLTGLENISKYIQCWIAHKLQKPCIKTNVCLLLYSIEEGTGKNALIDVFKKLFGDTYSIELEEVTNSLMGKHAMTEFRTLLCVVNETKGSQLFNDFEKFKNKVTSRETTFEPKGVDRFKCKIYCDYVMTTNNFYMPSSDRRVCYIETTNEFLRNGDYFSAFYNEIVDNPEAIRCIFEYFSKFDYRKYIVNGNFQNYIPESDYKQELKRLNRSPELDLLEYIIKDNNLLNTLEDPYDKKYIRLYKKTYEKSHNNYIQSLYDLMREFKMREGGSNAKIQPSKTFHAYFNQHAMKKINNTRGFEDTIVECHNAGVYFYKVNIERVRTFLDDGPKPLFEVESDEDHVL